MNKIKRTLSLILALCMMFPIMTSSVFASSVPMDHPADAGSIKYSKEFELIDADNEIYKVKARIEASDVRGSKKDQTVITMMTSSFLSQVKPELIAGVQSYIRMLFADRKEDVEIAVVTSGGRTVFPMSNYKQEAAMINAVAQVDVESGARCQPDYAKVFPMFDQNATKRSIAIWDGDGISNLDALKAEAAQKEISLYTIFIGKYAGLKVNVTNSATNPSMSFDANEGGIESKYREIVNNIKTETKEIGFNGGSLSYKLEEGLDILPETLKTDNGNVRYSRADNLIIWEINELKNEIYGKDGIKYAEMEYRVKINRNKVEQTSTTHTDNAAILVFTDNKGQERRISFAANEINFLKTIVNLEKRVAELEAEVERLNKEIDELNRQIKILNWDKERLQKQVNYLNDRLKEKQEELRVLSVKYENLKTQNRDLIYKNTVLENDVERLTKRVSKLEKDLEGANTTIRFQEAEIKRLNREIKDKDFEISSLKDKIQDLNNKILDKETDINLLKMENQRKDIEIDGLKQDIIDKEAKISDLEHDIELLNIDAKANKEEIARLKDIIAELKSDIRGYRNDIRRLEDDAQKNKEEIARLREIEKENEQRKITIASLESKIKDLERDKLDLERQLADAELKLKEMELQAKDNKDKMENLENDLEREKDLRRADTRRHEENYRAARDEVVYQKRLRDWEGFAMQKERDNDRLVMHYQDTIDKSALAMLIGNVVNDTANALSTSTGVIDYTFKIGSTTYTYRDHNGVVNTMGMEAAPFIENSRTYIPLRYVANAVGADVSWNDGNKTASFSKDGLNAYVQLNNNMIRLSNGNVVTMDVKPRIIKNRIFIPVRFVADIFGQNSVTWDGATQSVVVTR